MKNIKECQLTWASNSDDWLASGAVLQTTGVKEEEQVLVLTFGVSQVFITQEGMTMRELQV